MSSVLNNYSAMNAIRNLGVARTGLQDTLGRMSSGLRIVRASDDPAGLGISNRMRGDIAALNQGVRNAFEGINAVQTVDSALEQITVQLTRAITLAEQAASDTSGAAGSADKLALDSEYQGILSEIDRIASDTEFYGQTVLLGPLSDPPDTELTDGVDRFTVEVSTSTAAQNTTLSNRVTISFGGATVGALGLTHAVGTTGAELNLTEKVNAQNTLSTLKNAINDVSKNRVRQGVSMSRLNAAASASGAASENLQAAESGIRDAQMEHEIVNMTTNQILMQTGSVAIAQANAAMQMTLQLLR